MSKEMCGEGPIASPIVVDHTRLRNEIFGTDSVPSKWIGPLFQWNNPVLTYSDKKKNPLIFNTIEEINSKEEHERCFGRNATLDNIDMFPWLGETNDSNMVIRYYGAKIGDKAFSNVVLLESWIARDGRSVLYPRMLAGKKEFKDEATLKKYKLPKVEGFGIFLIHHFWCDGSFSTDFDAIMGNMMIHNSEKFYQEDNEGDDCAGDESTAVQPMNGDSDGEDSQPPPKALKKDNRK